jgi:hypothetical protein
MPDELLEATFENIGKRPRLRTRPQAIPGDRRKLWRVSVVALLLRRGRSNSLTLEHLHVFWWAVRSPLTREQFQRWLIEGRKPDDLIVRFDPSLSYTLDLAHGFGLTAVTKTGITLTAKGLALSLKLDDDDEVLADLKEYLHFLPNKITQTQFRQILDWQ